MLPALVRMTAYRRGSTLTTIGPAGAPRRSSERTLMTSGVPSKSGRFLSLPTTYSRYVPGWATWVNSFFTSLAASPLTATSAPAAGSILLPTKSVRTSRASPSDLTLTVSGASGGYHVRVGVRAVTSSRASDGSRCIGVSSDDSAMGVDTLGLKVSRPGGIMRKSGRGYKRAESTDEGGRMKDERGEGHPAF